MRILLALAAVFVFCLAVGIGDDTGAIPGYHHQAAAVGHTA
ncbi:MAG TPA: hypothetical protein VHF26_23745 [Trebonia sp.]|nr:hypothetical protein [Trebonia sp.]